MARRPRHHVFLIPGFFGFVNFGRLVYFQHVREFLDDAFAQLDFPVEIHRVTVSPTASLRTRAGQLVDALQQSAAGSAPIHLIGHSTGGLDARLVVTPSLSIGDGDVEPFAARVQSVVTVAAPHHGTPLASFFATRMGQQLLRALSLGTAAALRGARMPLGMVTRGAAFAARAAMSGGAPLVALLEHLSRELLGQLPGDDRSLVQHFAEDVMDDQALIPQLAPEALEIFNASTADRPGVRYGCVAARARPPRVLGFAAGGLDPWAHGTYALYSWLHGKTAGRVPAARRAPLDEPARRALRAHFGEVPDARDSDGIVPTLSQLWGELLYGAAGDHLDVIGHFDDPTHQPPHHDWVATGSGFTRAHFEALWMAVARFIAQAPRRP